MTASTMTVEVWHLVTLGITVIGAFFAVVKVLLMQHLRMIDERFNALASDSQAWRDLEREFLQFRVELPEKYVRREDYIRGQTVIESKLDSISSELKVVQIQGAKRES